MEARHVFKCPGDYKRNGIRYTLKGVTTEAELEAALEQGFSLTLKDAALKAGTIALVPEKKVSERKKARWEKLKGNPSTYPSNIEEYHDEPTEIEPTESLSPEVEKELDSIPSEPMGEAEEVEQDSSVEDAQEEPQTPKGNRKYPDLSDEEKMDILEHSRSGRGNADIAKEFGVHHFTIAKVIKELS